MAEPEGHLQTAGGDREEDSRGVRHQEKGLRVLQPHVIPAAAPADRRQRTGGEPLAGTSDVQEKKAKT